MKLVITIINSVLAKALSRRQFKGFSFEIKSVDPKFLFQGRRYVLSKSAQW